MKEVYRAVEFTQVGNYQSILENAGIPTLIRNEMNQNIDAVLRAPTLCVVNESDYDRAVEIIRELLKERELSTGTDIPCPACQEPNPGNFEVCWNCGAMIPPPAKA